MSTQLAKLAILSILLLAAANSSATMVYYYSSYDNVTLNTDSNGNPLSVTATLTLEGYTSWNDNPPAKHTGSVILIFGGVYNTNTTGEVNPNTEMDLSATVTLDATDTCFDDDTGCEVTQETADVTCTVAGFVFGGDGSLLGMDIELAYTKSQYIAGTQTKIGDGVSCGVRAWCSNGTPVCNPTIVDQQPAVLGGSASCWPYYNSSWLAERSSTSNPWRCISLLPGQNAVGTNDATQSSSCTVQ